MNKLASRKANQYNRMM